MGSRQWHKGGAARSLFMKFTQSSCVDLDLKGRSRRSHEPTNKLMNYSFCVAVDLEILERKCKTIFAVGLRTFACCGSCKCFLAIITRALHL